MILGVCVEAWALLDELRRFYHAIMVSIWREVTVSPDVTTVHSDQLCDQLQQGLLLFWGTCVCLMALTVKASYIGHTYTVRIMSVTMGTSYAYRTASLDVTIWKYYIVVPDVPPASREMILAYIGEADVTVWPIASGMDDDSVDDPHGSILEYAAGGPEASRYSIVRKGSKIPESDKTRRWVGGRSEVGRF